MGEGGVYKYSKVSTVDNPGSDYSRVLDMMDTGILDMMSDNNNYFKTKACSEGVEKVHNFVDINPF